MVVFVSLSSGKGMDGRTWTPSAAISFPSVAGGSSAVAPRVFSTGSVQQSPNQATSICKIQAEGLRGTKKQPKPFV